MEDEIFEVVHFILEDGGGLLPYPTEHASRQMFLFYLLGSYPLSDLKLKVGGIYLFNPVPSTIRQDLEEIFGHISLSF